MSPPTEQKTNSAVSIDDLPPEMISKLFEQLSLKDLASCSMVNKCWHSIYVAFKLHTLAVFGYRRYHFFHELVKWYGSNQPIPVESVCRPNTFLRLAEKSLLSNLKHLAISGSNFEFDLNELNRFQQLVHLEINISLDSERVHLNLLKLKVLAFHQFNRDCALSINSPALITLYLGSEDMDLLEVEHPETIRKLQTGMVGPQLAPFRSVESLVIEKFEAISQATLLFLPRLRELRLDQSIEWVFEKESSHGIGTADRMKRTLSEFVEEAKRLRSSDFQFIFCGFQLTNLNVDQIDFGVQLEEVDEGRRKERVSHEYVYMKNYHLIELGALHFVRLIDYTNLMSNLTGEFPSCFSQKFTGIESVYATTEVQDADHFLWFLKSLRFLRELELRNVKLSQEFYDQLPSSARSLRVLQLTDYWHHDLQLNFDFIGELSLLSGLFIQPQSVSFESIPSLVRSLGRLEQQIGECVFYVRLNMQENVWITKSKEKGLDWTIIRAYRSLFFCKDKTVFTTKNLDEILNFIEGIRANPNDRSWLDIRPDPVIRPRRRQLDS